MGHFGLAFTRVALLAAIDRIFEPPWLTLGLYRRVAAVTCI